MPHPTGYRGLSVFVEQHFFFLEDQNQADISISLKTVSPVDAHGPWNSSMYRDQSKFWLCDWRDTCLSRFGGLCRISELPKVVQSTQDPDCVVKMEVIVLSWVSCLKHSL